MNCGLVWAMGIAAVTASPSLTAIDFAVTDVGGGDILTLTGTALATLSGVEFSRDSGATWVAGTLGALTATTAKVSPPAMAASANGRVRVTGPGGTSGTLTLEFWSPAQLPNVVNYIDPRKGVVVTGTGTSRPITSVTDQGNGDIWLPNASGAQPTQLVQAIFGASSGFRMSPASGATASQALYNSTVGANLKRNCYSMFCVARTTVLDGSIDAYAGNTPQTIFGDTSSSPRAQFGFFVDQIDKTIYDPSVGWTAQTRGANLADGVARFIGTTMDPSTRVNALFIGSTQQGATWTPGPLDVQPGISAIGGGYSGSYANPWDGFRGDLGFAVTTLDAVSASNIAKLHTWARAGFGAA